MAKKWSKTALKALACAAQGYQGRLHGTSMLNLGRHYHPLLEAGLIEHRDNCRATDVYITPSGQSVLREANEPAKEYADFIPGISPRELARDWRRGGAEEGE